MANLHLQRRTLIAAGVAVTASAPVAALALLAAEGSPTVHGTITAKTYIPSATTMELQPRMGPRCAMVLVVVQVGSTTEDEEENQCSQVVIGYQYAPVTTDECWQLTVAAAGESHDVCVSRSDYDQAQIGAHW